MIAAEKRQIRLAAHWLDLQAPEDLGGDGAGAWGGDGRAVGGTLPGAERFVPAGADGTPAVAEFACAEFAALLGMHPLTGAAYLRKVANLRHRHPMLWGRVMRGEVRGWKALETARLVGRSELRLTQEQARWIDERSQEWITTLPWGSYVDLLEQLIVDADPRAAEDRRLEASTRQGVWTTQSNEHGLKTIVGKAAGGEITYLVAVVDRVAEILAARGDTREVGPRRGAALALLAHPAHVLALLAEDAALNAASQAEAGHAAEDAEEGAARRGDETGDPDRPAAADDGCDGADGQTRPGADTDAKAGSGREAEAGGQPDLPSYLAVPESLGAALTTLGRPGVLDRLLPTATLYVHLDQSALATGVGSARVEGLGTVTTQQALQWLGNRRVTVTPVIDLNDDVRPVDGYVFPRRIREVIHLRNPRDVFPFGISTSRHKDMDHPKPYRHPDHGGPPGQTSQHNAAPLTRFTHRVKTHGGWRLTQLDEVSYLWHSPHGYGWLVDATGTHTVSRTVIQWLTRAVSSSRAGPDEHSAPKDGARADPAA
jgi:hypothetical protein